MSYKSQLKKAAEWLKATQNADKGWGLAAGQASSIVNTAEAIFILKKACQITYREIILEGLRFIESKTLGSISRSPKTRYAFFALLICNECLTDIDPNFLTKCSKWLLKARNTDGAWGHIANNEDSRLYPTVMAMLVLHNLGMASELQTAVHWIISKKVENGWRFSDDSPVSNIATAQAVVALRRFRLSNDGIFTNSKEKLISATIFGIEAEDMPGTPWAHNSQMWIFSALTELAVNPYIKSIADGVREINKLECEQGWKEPGNHLTVRGQYWATVAFNGLQLAYDPAIHTYRIDSALANVEMQEPDFVRIFPHRKLSFVIPRVFYQIFTYSLICMSSILFLGAHRIIQLLPRSSDFFLSLILFMTFYLLIKKRKTLFPTWLLGTIISISSLLIFIDLILGYKLINIFEYASSLINLLIEKKKI